MTLSLRNRKSIPAVSLQKKKACLKVSYLIHNHLRKKVCRPAVLARESFLPINGVLHRIPNSYFSIILTTILDVLHDISFNTCVFDALASLEPGAVLDKELTPSHPQLIYMYTYAQSTKVVRHIF